MEISEKQLQHQETLEHTAREIANLLDKQKVIDDLSRRQFGHKSEVLESLLHRQQHAELTRRLTHLLSPLCWKACRWRHVRACGN